ncbi:MAG TPA: hypothetical protein VFC19_18980 [Candidatus Limnocylindrales bacterium]|nr:hypothetical protein [Candidatus Limnocylindrales bacterium]
MTAVAILAFVIGWRVESRRKERIRQWAHHHGWIVTFSPIVDWATRLPKSRRRGVSLLVSGVVGGRPVAVAEYSYHVPDSDGQGTTYRYVVTAVRLPVSYQPIAVQPRGVLSRVGLAMFGGGATTIGHAAFDRDFRVHTKNPALVRTLLGPTLIAEHVARRVPFWSLAGPDLLTWQDGKIVDPSRIPATAANLVRVADLLGR